MDNNRAVQKIINTLESDMVREWKLYYKYNDIKHINAVLKEYVKKEI